MLTAEQLRCAKASLVRVGIRAWHIDDADAPPIVQAFGSLQRIVDQDPFWQDQVGIKAVSSSWALARSVPVEIWRWAVKRQPAYMVLHPVLTYRDLGFSQAGPFDSDGFLDFQDGDGTILDTECLDNNPPMREFVIGIKAVALMRPNATALGRYRAELMASQAGLCAECHCTLPKEHAHVDHIVPWLWGGNESLPNLRACCPDCNQRRSQSKKEMECAWLHAAGIVDAGWTPATFDMPVADRAAAWELAKPDAVQQALIARTIDVRDERRIQRARTKRIASDEADRKALREAKAGTAFVPFDTRSEPWDAWPAKITADPLRFAGMDDYEFLAALGDPIVSSDPALHYQNDPKRRSRLRRRLHKVLEGMGWVFGRYDYERTSQDESLDSARRYVPADCDIAKVMGAGFQLGDHASGEYDLLTRTFRQRTDMATRSAMLDAALQNGTALPADFFDPPTDQARKASAKPVFKLGQDAPSDALAGKRFCITGAFKKCGRTALEGTITRCGGKITGSVSKRTDFLIVGARPGAKQQKASDLGIPQIDLVGLAALLKPVEPTLPSKMGLPRSRERPERSGQRGKLPGEPVT